MGATNVSALKPLLDARGAGLIGVGLEKLGFEEFSEGKFFSGELYVDEAKATFKALNLPRNSWRNLWGLTGGKIFGLSRAADKLGHTNNLAGDAAQLGATFVFDKGGKTLYAHLQANDDFEPDLDAILKALDIEKPEGFGEAPAADSAKE